MVTPSREKYMYRTSKILIAENIYKECIFLTLCIFYFIYTQSRQRMMNTLTRTSLGSVSKRLEQLLVSVLISSTLCINVLYSCAKNCNWLSLFNFRFSILILSLYLYLCFQMLRLKETCYRRTVNSQQKPAANWRHIWPKNSKSLPLMKARKCGKSCKGYISFCYLFFSLYTCLPVYFVCLFTCVLVNEVIKQSDSCW